MYALATARQVRLPPQQIVRLRNRFSGGGLLVVPGVAGTWVDLENTRRATAASGMGGNPDGVADGVRYSTIATSGNSGNYTEWTSDATFDPPSSGYSMFMLARRRANGGSTYNRIWHRDVTGTASDGFGFLVASSTDGTAPNRVYFVNQTGGTGTNIGYVAGNPVSSVDRFWHYIFTHDGTTGFLYVNGVLVDSQSCGIPGSSSKAMRLGRHSLASTTGAPFDVAAFGYIRHKLPPQQCRSVWQLLEPRRAILPFEIVEAGAPTITALSAISITATSAQPRISYS